MGLQQVPIPHGSRSLYLAPFAQNADASLQRFKLASAPCEKCAFSYREEQVGQIINENPRRTEDERS